MDKFIETSRGQVALTISGAGSTNLLFIHGNSASKSVFKNQVDSDLAKSYRMVSIDLLGHGDSANSTNSHSDYTVKSYANLVCEVVKMMELSSVVIVGWSLGGHIAIEAVAQGLDATGMVITGTPPVGPGVEHMRDAFKTTETMGLTGKQVFTETDVKNYAAAIMGGEKYVSNEILTTVSRTDGISRPIMLENFTSDRTLHDQRKLVESWDNPIAVFHGEEDTFVQTKYLNSLSWNNLWRQKIHLFKNAGHAPFWEMPENFNRLLSEFLNEL